MSKNQQSNSNVIQFPISGNTPADSLDEIKGRLTRLLGHRYSAEIEYFCSRVPESRNDGKTYKIDIEDELCHYRHILVSPQSPLSNQDMSDIRDLIASLFVPAVRLYNQNTLLRRYEENMSAHGDSSVGRVSQKPNFTPPPIQNREKGLELDFPAITLESANEDRLRKFACEVHEATDNFAMLSWSDIKGRIYSTQDLEQMEGCTIFVEDVSELSVSDGAIIWDYIKNKGLNGPLVVVGVAGELNQLGEPNFNPDFIDDLSSVRISIDRLPLTQVDVKELLELFQ